MDTSQNKDKPKENDDSVNNKDFIYNENFLVNPQVKDLTELIVISLTNNSVSIYLLHNQDYKIVKLLKTISSTTSLTVI